MSDRNYSQRVAGEIRAEMARQRKTTAELAVILDMRSIDTARLRFNGEYPFDLLQLAKVAIWLNVSPAALAGTEAVA